MTLTPQTIKDAICDVLRSRFPQDPIYTDIVPMKFERPSTLVELQGIDMDTQSCGAHSVLLTWRFRLTAFVKTDAAHQSHFPELDQRGMTLLAAFATGYLKVADRAPSITNTKLDTTLNDCVRLDLALSITVDRDALLLPEEPLPVMKDLHTRFTDK